MGLLSGLIKLGGFAAAPFTGGASIPITQAISGFGQAAGKAAGGAASGRQLETQNILSQDALRNQQFNTQQNAQMQAGGLDLQRKNFEEDARGGRAKQALIASILGGGFQPGQVSVPGVKNATMTGGLGASLQNPGAQSSMQELLKQALAAQMAQGEGEKFSGGQILQAPQLSALPKAGKMEKFLGGAGLVASLLGSVMPQQEEQ